GDSLSNAVQSFADSFTSTFDTALTAVNEGVTEGVLNPLQDLLADSPWYVTGTAIVALVWVLSGVWPTVVTAACLGGMLAVGLWYDSMLTLAMTLVGTLIVMALALVLGVWMARRPRVDLVLRPVLDAAQVMPPFVYLIPALLLFGFGRFTAILAGVVYAAPIAIKLVADGIQRVSATTVEAAEASGSTPWQVITKVQLPMARGNLLLAANQGLLYVLSMVVIGGLIGAQALGYASVLGFSQSEFFGKGLAAAICIVLMGIMLDRVARGAAARQTERAAATDRMLVKTPIPAAPTG
ncbi:MAG: ABC transporter permease subunit, partial [Actinomycetota bacterium]|nr:ABC transporter permease subunit [Actinomycetota bacterium]